MLIFSELFSIAQEIKIPPISESQILDYRYDQDFLSPAFHKQKRSELRAKMPQGAVAILFATPVKNRSNDVNYEYKQDPNFYYLTGLNEPNAVLLIFKEAVEINGKSVSEIAFVQKRDVEMEAWNGKRFGPEGVGKVLQIEMALKGDEYYKIIQDLKSFSQVWVEYPKGLIDEPFNKADLYDLVNYTKKLTEEISPENIKQKKLEKELAAMREIKTEEEIKLITRAVEITCLAHMELMSQMNDQLTEYQAQAIVEYIFRMNGSEYPGFPSIIGSGENSCILHYTTNRKPLRNGELVVCDIGAEYRGYTADVTRTIPVNGKFSKEQEIIYNIVLEAQEAGVKECKKGNPFYSTNIAATTIISQRLMGLGIIKSPAELRKYLMHGVSHYLGLDVHDPGTYGEFKPNTIITVEPGIYIPEGSPCDPKWWNIGVRIEDDILITDGEPINLSACVPRTVKEIEALTSK
ncbi:MAG: aminopeptidase P N-terminal domain-containing protein [Flavobacteriales bacterium]